MQTHIVFNGKEYAGLEEMPDDARKAFQAALGQVGTDADANAAAAPIVLTSARGLSRPFRVLHQVT